MPLARIRRQLLTFAPDKDPITPDILIDGNDFIPTVMGVRTLPQLHIVTEALPTLEECLGACVVTFGDGQQFVIAGTATSLNWVKSASLSPITPPPWEVQITSTLVPAIERWRFTFYANYVIAVNGVDPPWYTDQFSLNGANAWLPLPGNPPISSIVAASDYSLFLIGETSPAVLPVQTNQWWSTLNPFDWTPSQATQTVHNALDQSSGPITAARPLRGNMVLYKASGTWPVQLVGGQLIWIVQGVSRQVGAVSHEASVLANDIHWFLGPDDFYSFDGFNIQRIPNDHREWFFQRCDTTHLRFVFARFDSARSLIFWHFGVKDQEDVATTATEWVALNVRTGKWTNGHRKIEMTPCGVAPDTVLDPTYGQTAGLFQGAGHLLEVYGQTGDGANVQSYLTTGDVGDRHYMYQLSRVRPGIVVNGGPAGSPTLTPLNSYTPGSPYVAGAEVALSSDGWHNILNTARLQRLKIQTDSDLELADLELTLNQVGEV